MTHCWLRFRFHCWRNKSTQQLIRYKWWEGKKMPQSMFTLVLKQCSCCGREKVKKLDGSWELEDLT